MRMSFALFQLHQMAVTGLLLKVTPLFWHRVVPFTQIQMMPELCVLSVMPQLMLRIFAPLVGHLVRFNP